MHPSIPILARLTSRPLADVAELFTERAAIRQFLGGFPRAEAERLAFEDARRMLEATKGL